MRVTVALPALRGGASGRRVVLLLACVLALDGADGAAVGALAPQLERAFRVGNVGIGLLVSSTAVVGALATLPVGALADRVRRVPLLWTSILAWSAAMVASGLSTSYPMLLVTRLGLGAVTATAGPTVASLTGDLFPPRERGRIYGLILAGETAGLGAGFLLAGDVAAALSWRIAFLALAVPGIGLAVVIQRLLPEPPRREAGRLLGDDPVRMSLWRATRLVLGIRTNVLLILSSSLGYFFLGGIRTFAVLFLRTHFSLPQATAASLVPILGIGALVGVLTGGRLADRLVRQGRTDARILVPAISFAVAAALFLPGSIVRPFAVAVPLYVAGAAALAAPNPPLDAARLDIMHPRLWGRAESIRTVLRTLLQGGAPLVFGYVSRLAGGVRGTGSTNAGDLGGAAPGGAGLEETFLIMLVPLLLSSVLLLAAARTYPRDVATAAASERERQPSAAVTGTLSRLRQR